MELIGPITQQAIRTLATQRLSSDLIKETTPYIHTERRGGGGINFTVALSPNGLCSIYDHKFVTVSSNQNKENLLRYLIHLYFWIDSL